jgi:hypothetical protein
MPFLFSSIFTKKSCTWRKFKWAYELYMSPGWAYNLAEKQVRIAKERERVAKDAQECHQKNEYKLEAFAKRFECSRIEKLVSN